MKQVKVDLNQKYCQRHAPELRRPTSSFQNLPDQLKSKLSDFYELIFTNCLIFTNFLGLSNILLHVVATWMKRQFSSIRLQLGYLWNVWLWEKTCENWSNHNFEWE